MSSILRQIVAGPRLQHPEAGLDLCYVTDNIIATSGPSGTYPQRAYRNPLDSLVQFLDSKHGSNWCIWEFRAEGTGYPDSEVYDRIHHFPWPDHHPPPFALIPNIMGSMRNWLQRLEQKEGDEPGKRVAVVHCKAGKGRSGTVATGYLISQEGWKKEEALQRFTERRMRVGFGNGVSIPSQMRYVGYIDRWTNEMGKEYVERPVEILEVHIWGLKDGVKVAVEGFANEGKKIKGIHLFHRSERTVVAEENPSSRKEGSSSKEKLDKQPVQSSATWSPAQSEDSTTPAASTSDLTHPATISSTRNTLSAVIFRPSKPIIVPGSDVNIDFERRSKGSYTGLAMVTSVAHVWFNAYFEGGQDYDSGIFAIEWDGMDGIKGSARKGIRAFERLKVVWRYPSSPSDSQQNQKGDETTAGKPISEPKPGEPIPESAPADWRGPEDAKKEDRDAQNSEPEKEKENKPAKDKHAIKHTSSGSKLLAVGAGSLHEVEKSLGLRKQTDESKDVSLAGSEDDARSIQSTTDDEGKAPKEGNGDLEGVKSHFVNDGTGNKASSPG
ncbi:Phosphatase tensin type [Penicillium cinerascens]|uniref:phosphatidylinositol-3,4,5-trisphosphate 3-phosphatase n=1 Tax=Penicillium cinerascens TaxID=70096 RepID=A0A9W9N9C7_9EURO|nr:Phosphatase tensin type [Penicillium cinerascens]KAJ5215609.1 Phosphatase tensin type [Penicillium cinerascens]